MRIAYLVFAYHNPLLLGMEIRALSSEDADFFVHIDGKQDISPFASLSADNVHFLTQRIKVYWAEFSGVEAILALIREALKAPKQYDYLVLLSGSEYPIRSRGYIQHFLETHQGSEFISLCQMPAPGKPLSRINTLRFPSTKPVRRLIARALAKGGLGQRDYTQYLGSLAPYSGMTWWALTSLACRYITAFVEANPCVSAYFENVFAPEETFIHTILGNSEFRSRVRKNLVYEDWTAQGGHPAMISDMHIALFESHDIVQPDTFYGPGEALFARKFSDDTINLVQRIDKMIEWKEKRWSRSTLEHRMGQS